MSATFSTLARCLVGALVCVAPAMLGAGAPDRAQWKDGGPLRAEAARGWDGKVQGIQIVTPVELRFDDPRDLEAFAAGRLPIGVTLRSAASGRTIRFEPGEVREGYRPGRGGPLMLYVVIDQLVAPVWDESGCIETRMDAANGPDGGGVELALAYAACGGPVPSRSESAVNPIPGIGLVVRTRPQGMVAGNPITGIIVKGGKNPGGNLMVTPRPGDVGPGAAARLSAGQNLIILSSSKGNAPPKAQGF